jgi:hypothetical protein
MTLLFCSNVIIYIFFSIYFISQRRNHDEVITKKYKGRNDSKQNGMDLLQRNFERSPVSEDVDTFTYLHIN